MGALGAEAVATPPGAGAAAWRRWCPLVAWVGLLGATIAAFTGLGDGDLQAPRLADPNTWGTWAANRPVEVATVAILRLVVLAMAWYLAGVTALGVVARVARAGRLVRAVDVLSLPIIRRVVRSALGMGLATAMTTSAIGPSTPSTPSPVTVTLATHAPSATAADEPAPPPPDAAIGPADPVTGPGPAGLPGSRPAAVHTVVVGEHLWSIAEDHLRAALGRSPGDREVATHWRALIAANRDRLVDRDNPDLILPGQQFLLPAPPTTPKAQP